MFANRERLASTPAHKLALDCLAAGIEAARPENAVKRHCAVEDDTFRIDGAEYDLSDYDSIRVLGGGKAADDLAAAFETLLDDRIDSGVVVTNERTADPETVAVRTGNHPIPGEDSLAGATAVLEAAKAADDSTLVIAAITGGGSALLCAPIGGLTVENIRTVTDGLLNAGASIDEINIVRRACSKIKGGGLTAAAAPATVVGVLISDVVGDDHAVIASGPTVPAAIDPSAALAVLDRYEIDAAAVRTWLRKAEARDRLAGDADNYVIISGRDAVKAASRTAAESGYGTRVLSTQIEGESTESGRFHAAIAAEAVKTGEPIESPGVILSAGETTVRVRGDGTGGPNQEFALAAASELPSTTVLAAVDTDGKDGSTDAAGALVDASTVEKPDEARAALADNDSYGYLDQRSRLLRTGATGTNVNDLRVIVIPSSDTAEGR